MDIFKRIVYFLQLGESGGGPQPVPVEKAMELINASNKGEKIHSLSDYVIQDAPEAIEETYSNVVGQDDLNRFDNKKGNKRRPNRRFLKGKKRS